MADKQIRDLTTQTLAAADTFEVDDNSSSSTGKAALSAVRDALETGGVAALVDLAGEVITSGTLPIARLTRTGSDASVVTGTAGTSGELAMWNADGDAVDSTVTAASVVEGPSSATDNSVPTYDATTGKLMQDQGSLLIDDSGYASGYVNVLDATVASGSIALPTHTLPAVWFISVDTENGDAADDLANVTGAVAGDLMILQTEDSGRDVTAKDAAGGAGQMQLAGDYALATNTYKLVLVAWGASIWHELSRNP